MIGLIKKWWKFSKFRYYILNTIWNYKFWLCSYKVYKNIDYYHFESPRQDPNFTFYINSDNDVPPVIKSRKRFVGYSYKGNIYLDNPGLKISDRELWRHWHKKGLL